MSAQDMNAPDSWHDRKVFDYQTGHYLGRAVGEPFSDGVEGLIALRQDESGLTIKSHALCAFVVLDDPARSLLADQGGAETCCCPAGSYNPGNVHEDYCPLGGAA